MASQEKKSKKQLKKEAKEALKTAIKKEKVNQVSYTAVFRSITS